MQYYGQRVNNYRLPIYVSITSIYKNQERLYNTLISLKNQTLTPDKIFVYLSEEPFLLDEGFSQGITNNLLLNELNNSIYNLVWTKNEGSYRKLIPLLKEKWNEDCVIITVDDDVVYHDELIEKMYFDFLQKGCSIANRGFKSNKFVTEYEYILNRTSPSEGLYNFATGKGAILYHPSFFHKTKKIFNSNIYLSDKLKTKDDIWFYINRVENDVNVYLTIHNWLSKDNTDYSSSLSNNYNSIEENSLALSSL